MIKMFIRGGFCFAFASGIAMNAAHASKLDRRQLSDSQVEVETNRAPGVIRRADLQAKIARSARIILVDALPENYFALSHLPGSINIPFEKAHELAERTLPDKKAEIVVYCMDAT